MKMRGFQVDKKLLPIKGHYFLQNAGLAPITPFIPIIAKGLGFSSISVGWLYTITPIVSLFVKPLIGSIADKFKIVKPVFVFLLILSGVSLFAIQWVPPVWSTNAVINCESGRVELCSDNDIGQDNKSLFSTNNALCEITMKNEIQATITKDQSFQVTESDADNITEHFQTTTISRLQISPTKGNCLSLQPVHKEDMKSICIPEFQNTTMLPINVKCNDIASTHQNPTESEILSKYQFWMMLLLVVVLRVSTGICNTLADTICYNLLGDAPEKYGMQRMWGGIGWGVVAFLSSLLVDAISKGTTKDYSLSFYIMLAFAIPDLIIVFNIKMNPNETSKNLLSDVSTVLKDTKIIIFLLWCFINGYFLSSITSFLFWYVEDLDSAQGHGSSTWIKTLEGLISFVQTCGGEVPLFFVSGWILKKTGYVNAMTLVLLGSSLRFFLYSVVTEPWLVLPIETLHGISFGLFYATMTSYAKTISLPGTECTVQSLVSVTYEGAGYSAGSLLTGYLIESIGYTKTFSIMAISAFVFCAIHFTIVNFSLLSSLTTRLLKLDSGQGAEAVRLNLQPEDGTYVLKPVAAIKSLKQEDNISDYYH